MSGEDSMPWQVVTLVQTRLELCRLAESGEVSFVELCRRFGVSPKTGYKWLTRYRVEGVAGLEDRSRVPLRSPARSSAAIEDEVCRLRDRHPAWGSRKIRNVLIRRGFPRETVPAPSTITGILRRNNRLGPPAPSAGGYRRFQADAPNRLWQMDFKGWVMTGEGRADPFDILDDHSRFNLCLRLSDQEAPSVRQLLESTFHVYGLPDKILCDNGAPWGNTQPGHRWTGLGVWLLDLGIGVIHSRPRHPQTLGKDERFHRTLDLEVISTRPRWDSHQQLQTALDQWRPIYNYERPHDSLDGATPADRYRPSPRSLPTIIPAPDYPDGYQVRKVSTQAQISFHGQVFRIGAAFKGRQVGILPTTTDGNYYVYYRHQLVKTIAFT